MHTHFDKQGHLIVWVQQQLVLLKGTSMFFSLQIWSKCGTNNSDKTRPHSYNLDTVDVISAKGLKYVFAFVQILSKFGTKQVDVTSDIAYLMEAIPGVNAIQ